MKTRSTNIWNCAQPGRPSRAVAIVLMHVAAAWLPVMLSAADAQTGDSAGTAANADVGPKMADPPMLSGFPPSMTSGSTSSGSR